MKRSVVIPATAMLLIVTILSIMAFKNNGSGSIKNMRKEIIGTWQLESYKYGPSSSSFTSVTSDRPHFKLITENMFLWATYDAATKKILESAGGTYSLNGENYVESIDYGLNMDSYLGTMSNFKIKIEDGMFYQTGELGDGYKIEEIWQKVK